MVSKKKVIENSFFYIISSLLVKAMGFILLPIYTRYMMPSEFGIINLVTGFINIANFIIAFSLYSTAIRFYTDYKEDNDKLKKLYSTLMIFILLSGCIFLILGIIFQKYVISVFFYGLEFYPIVLIAFISLIFISLYTMHQSILRGMQQGKKLTAINLAVFVLSAFFKIIAITFLKSGVYGFLVANLLVYLGYSVYLVHNLIKQNLLGWEFDINMLKEALKYSIPLMPHNLSTNIASFASRIFINTSKTLAVVGLYSMAMQFGNLIDIVQISVNKAFQPWFYEMMKVHDEDSISQAVSLSRILLIIYSLVYMLIGLFAQETIILMTNPKYTLSWTAIPILVVGFSVKSMYYFYVNIIMYYKKAARKLFVATILGSAADIVLAYILVPYFGMYGSAISFLLAKVIIVCITINISKKFDDIGYRAIKMLGIIIPSLVFMAIGLYFSYTKYLLVFNIYNLFYKLLVLLLYIVYVYFTNRTIISKALTQSKSRLDQLLKQYKIKSA